MMYKSEEEFLAAYNPEEFDRLSLTTDILILSISDEEVANYRKSSKKYMSVLLVKRDDYPFKGKWCLPGGFLDVKEDLEDCPRRILAKETNLHDIYLEQLYTYGSVNRDIPKVVYVNGSGWIEPIADGNYEEIINNAFNKFKNTLKKVIISSPLFENKFVCDFDLKTTSLKVAKKNYLSFARNFNAHCLYAGYSGNNNIQ